MVSDRTESEPDEYDPEADLRDPESDSITIPRVTTEDAGSGLRAELKAEFEEERDAEALLNVPEVSTSETDVDSELLKAFWSLALVINVAVLAFSLGVLFLLFEGAVRYATYLVAAGLVLTGFAIRRYRTVRHQTDSASADGSDADPDDGTLEDDEFDDSDAPTDDERSTERQE